MTTFQKALELIRKTCSAERSFSGTNADKDCFVFVHDN